MSGPELTYENIDKYLNKNLSMDVTENIFKYYTKFSKNYYKITEMKENVKEYKKKMKEEIDDIDEGLSCFLFGKWYKSKSKVYKEMYVKVYLYLFVNDYKKRLEKVFTEEEIKYIEKIKEEGELFNHYVHFILDQRDDEFCYVRLQWSFRKQEDLLKKLLKYMKEPLDDMVKDMYTLKGEKENYGKYYYNDYSD